jgi:hypothetical protein
MGKAFGIDFVVVSDVRGRMDPFVFKGGPWVHLATVVRGFRTYLCVKHSKTQKVYVEEFDEQTGTFHELPDPEWKDLVEFLTRKGILSYAVGHEYKVATHS